MAEWSMAGVVVDHVDHPTESYVEGGLVVLKSRLLGAVGIVAVIGGVLVAQTSSSPAFEVASIKIPSVEGSFSVQVQPGGRFTAANMPLMDLIGMAYGIPAAFARARIVGGPAWITVDRFDIAAKTRGNWAGDAFSQHLPAMLRTLLESRFAFKAHTEPRQLPAYGLLSLGRTA
jgi:hypothetical protein